MQRCNVTKSFVYEEKLEFFEHYQAYEFSCRFHLENFDIELYEKLEVNLPIEIQGSGASRQAEFLAGRYAAKRVLTALNLCNHNIDINHDRRPKWPVLVTGSISHTSDKVLCCAAGLSVVKKIGIDIEPWFSKKVTEEIMHEILSPIEILIASKINIPFQRALTLCFSAKESIYKALGGHFGDNPSFKQLELKSISLESKTIHFIAVNDKSDRLMTDESYVCGFKYDNEHTITRYFNK